TPTTLQDKLRTYTPVQLCMNHRRRRYRSHRNRRRNLVVLATLGAIPAALIAHDESAWGATTLRIVEYNIDSSDIGDHSNLPDVTTVLHGIGLHHMAGNAQMPDVIGLTELLDASPNNSSSTSLPALLTDLNNIYGAGAYAYDPTPDPTSGGTSLNGPNGLI